MQTDGLEKTKDIYREFQLPSQLPTKIKRRRQLEEETDWIASIKTNVPKIVLSLLNFIESCNNYWPILINKSKIEEIPMFYVLNSLSVYSSQG